jgi:hypothetical protein
MALVAAQRLSQPRLLQKAVAGFFDSYDTSGGAGGRGGGGWGGGKGCMVEEWAGLEWWRPIVEVGEKRRGRVFPYDRGGRGGSVDAYSVPKTLAHELLFFTQPQKQELEVASPTVNTDGKGCCWRAQWALLQEARRRGLGVEGENGLRVHALQALEAAAAAAAGSESASASASEGRAAGALLLLERGGEEDVGPAVLSLIR